MANCFVQIKLPHDLKWILPLLLRLSRDNWTKSKRIANLLWWQHVEPFPCCYAAPAEPLFSAFTLLSKPCSFYLSIQRGICDEREIGIDSKGGIPPTDIASSFCGSWYLLPPSKWNSVVPLQHHDVQFASSYKWFNRVICTYCRWMRLIRMAIDANKFQKRSQSLSLKECTVG